MIKKINFIIITSPFSKFYSRLDLVFWMEIANVSIFGILATDEESANPAAKS
jgi:hypothetical protein